MSNSLIDEIPQKPIEYSFRDWESDVFGFGYGNGEDHIIPALRQFLSLCGKGDETQYDYRKLEEYLAPTVAWLLINALCHADMIEYGTSPRFGWLTGKGKRLKEYMLSKTADELIEIACNHGEEYIHCSPNYCNCGKSGYVEGRKCPNPFWGKD